MAQLPQDLPHVRESLVDVGNTASRGYYLFWEAVDVNLKQAQADIAVLQASSGGGSSTTLILSGNESVALTGSAAAGFVSFALVNDQASVTGHERYGSDSGGNKGWAPVADDFASTSNIALSTDVNGVVSFDLTDLADSGAGVLLAFTRDSKGRVTGTRAATITAAAGISVANGDASSGLPTITNTGVLSLAGTAHQVIVSAATGAVTLSLPQSIDTTSSPSFAAVNLSADPTTALQAATKQYVDNIAAGLSWKAPVQVATTANITLSGTQTIDGVSVLAGARVLVKDQTTQANNGIYVVQSGAWTRATDMDSWAEVTNASVFVSQGTANADKAWTCTADAGGTLGTTAIPFVQFSSVMGGVTSFNGRNGVVVPAAGDYTFSLIGGIATVAQGGTGVSTASANLVFAGPSSGAAAAPSFRTLVAADVASALPTDYISGLKLIWNSATSISVGTGSAVIPSTGKLETVSATLTLSSLVLSASTFYHVYLYDNAGTPAIECVTTAPASPYQGTARAKTGDTTRRYIGSVLSDGSGNLIGFNHYNSNKILYDAGGSRVAPFRVLSAGSATTPTAVSLASIVPLTALAATVILTAASGTPFYNIRKSTTGPVFISYPAIASGNPIYPILTDISSPGQSIAYDYSASGGSAYIDVAGYFFER
jgi:hypothetical protein